MPPPTTDTDRLPKRRALLDGARDVFAADGYSRATVDGIARRAGVSSRTIYNQFRGKAELFRAVIVDSAEHVAVAQVELVDRHLGRITDAAGLEPGLIAFGRVWATPDPRFTAHFALVRQVGADIEHVPAAAVREWRDVGPGRVRTAVARHLRRLTDLGLLAAPDADGAALHLITLATAEAAERRQFGPRAGAAELHRMADAGVRAFLGGYRPGPVGGPAEQAR